MRAGRAARDLLSWLARHHECGTALLSPATRIACPLLCGGAASGGCGPPQVVPDLRAQDHAVLVPGLRAIGRRGRDRPPPGRAGQRTDEQPSLGVAAPPAIG